MKFKNPVQKLLSICFAITIWAFAPSPNKELTEVKFFVPVSYINLPKNLEIVSAPLQSISVSVELAKNELAQVHPSMFQAVIDLEGSFQGEKEYEITRKIVSAPDNIRILEIEPKLLNLSFEEIIEKELPIKPVFLGEPAQGYVLEQITMIPPTVRTKGLVSELGKIEQLNTKAVNIEGIDSDIEMLVHIIFPKSVAALEPAPEYYTVQITVGSEPINMRYLNIPIGIMNHEYVTRINPRYFNMLVRGPRSLMENFKKQDIQAFIDLEGFKPGNYKIKAPTVRLPPEIQIQQMWPPIDIWVKNQKIE
jgi:YbbR domain-containing protein